MKLRFCIQDPTHVETMYLDEAILAAVSGAISWRGVYAFASRDGVDHLISDRVVHDYMKKGGEIDLLIGIDAVTNRPTLERLRELEHQNPKFRPKVFWNSNSNTGLFHPKISEFTYEDGRRTLIVGSGNLTLGGLRRNFEGYTIVSVDRADELDISALDEFLAGHATDIRSIDNEALERAARNPAQPIQSARRRRQQRGTGVGQSVAVSAPEADRILIAQVPRAGNRWAQVHFNADVVRDYFRIIDYDTHRVCLTQVAADGNRSKVEVRPCVYSQRNRNPKIEIGAAKGKEKDYPDSGPPILVFRERQLRTFDYMLVMPDENGYGLLAGLTERLPSHGRGRPRTITTMDCLANSWLDCPLLTSGDANEQEF